jgi:hypothetical protein
LLAAKFMACSSASVNPEQVDGAGNVIEWGAAALMAAALGQAAADAEPSPIAPMQFAQLTIRRQLLVRIPVRPRPDTAAIARESRIEWKEKGGPKCVPAQQIVAATAFTQKSVDLILRDRSRMRAKLERSCPALDYYFGFYIMPAADGQICADRDSIRSRVGGECGIDRFRTLKAAERD